MGILTHCPTAPAPAPPPRAHTCNARTHTHTHLCYAPAHRTLGSAEEIFGDFHAKMAATAARTRTESGSSDMDDPQRMGGSGGDGFLSGFGADGSVKWSSSNGSSAAVDVQGFTKWVPKPGVENGTADVVDTNVRLALTRMRLDKLPLMQFHTWDYLDGPGLWLQQLRHLAQHPGVERLGLTNFDAAHLRIALVQ